LGLTALSSCIEEDMRVNKMMPFFSGSALDSIRPLMEAWYDGTVSGSSLIDRSGNGRNGTIAPSLVTDWDANLGFTWINLLGGTTPTTATSIGTNPRPGSASTKVFKIRVDSAPAFSLQSTEQFVLRAGETVNYEFFVYPITGTLSNISWGIRHGQGSNQVSGTMSGKTLNQWNNTNNRISGSFTCSTSGGLACLTIGFASGTYEIDISDITISVTGDADYFTLPNVAALKTVDAKNHFYNASGIPLTTRGNYQFNAYNAKIICGGPMSYIFLTNIPTEEPYAILADNFEDLDHAWDSCPITLDVGTGQTYALPQNAVNASTGNATFRHRRKIVFHNDFNINTYAEYTVLSGGGFMAWLQANKNFDHFTSNSGIVNLIFKKEITATDLQLVSTEPIALQMTGGLRGINMEVYYGGYRLHMDFTSAQNNFAILKDFTCVDMGGQDIFDYRINNSLPLPAGALSFSALAGGSQPNYVIKMKDVYFESIYPISWQDVACVSAGQLCYMVDVEMNAVAIYDPVSNPTQSIANSLRLVSSGNAASYIYGVRSILNTPIVESGAVKSIFYEEL
jgi:hypothetical protein